MGQTKLMFAFVPSDLQRPVKDVFGTAVSYGDLHLTRKLYTACENIDFFHEWNAFDLREVRKYGFDYVEAFRVAAVRCHVYNVIKACRQETLATVLSAYVEVETVETVEVEPRTLEDALAHITIKTLFKIGWTFWSMPLGTFSERLRELRELRELRKLRESLKVAQIP